MNSNSSCSANQSQSSDRESHSALPSHPWSYDELKDLWRVSDKIVTTRNVTQSAIGDRDGLWLSVVAAEVFVDLPTDGR